MPANHSDRRQRIRGDRLYRYTTLPFYVYTHSEYILGVGIRYKLAVLVYKCLNGMAPSYLADEFFQPADLTTRTRLRSASSLFIRHTRLSTVGDRAFPVAAARVWNSLPRHRSIDVCLL